MKKIFYFMSLAAIVAVMMSCGKKEADQAAEEGGSGSSAATPTRIAFPESLQEFYISEGQEFQMTWTVSPANVDPKSYLLKWSSSDESVVSVDKSGLIKGIASGTATIKVSINDFPDVKPATATVTVLAPVKVGDFIYSDGSWGSSKVVEGKEIIAIVYWLGDPTLYDPILEEQFKNCTHGLAMSLKQGPVGKWQKDFQQYYFGEGGSTSDYKSMANSAFCDDAGTMTEWLINKSSYGETALPYLENKDVMIGDMYIGVGGYTLTASMEEFMQKDAKAKKYPLEIYTNTMKLVEGIATPATTSRWYIPGVYEVALMINTALTKPSDFNNDDVDKETSQPLVQHNNKNVAFLNNILSGVTGADLLPIDPKAAMASASDVYMPINQEFIAPMGMDCGDFWAYFAVTNVATDGAPTTEEDKLWKEWLEENAPDKVDTYMAYQKTAERREIFLKVKGLEGKVTNEKIGGAGLVLGLSMFGTLLYANVSVQDGMLHTAPYFLTGDYHQDTGAKGVDNTLDYVRAVIAF